MKKIPLTKGQVALVDDEDYERLSKFKWHFTSGYAARHDASLPSKRSWMHREILGLKPGEHVDHINRNRLDNQRSNLRPCTITENNWNTGPQRHKRYSSYKGVSFNKERGLWRVQIAVNGQRYFIGDYKEELHATIAYTAAARVLHKQFALSFDPIADA